MTRTGTTGYHCLLPFNFEDPFYKDIDTLVLDYGMGITSEYLFESALKIMFDLTDIDVIIDYLDINVFPEHVPNDSLSASLSLCITYINHVLSAFIGFKSSLNLLVTRLDDVTLHPYASTVSVNVNLET